jgi:hypothetical protein
VLVVGGTHPTPIVSMLEAHGMSALWWSGLKHDEFHRPIPRAIALVIVVTDAINHSMLARIRARCRTAGVPVMFSRSRKSELHPRIQSWLEGAQRWALRPAIGAISSGDRATLPSMTPRAFASLTLLVASACSPASSDDGGSSDTGSEASSSHSPSGANTQASTASSSTVGEASTDATRSGDPSSTAATADDTSDSTGDGVSRSMPAISRSHPEPARRSVRALC